MNELGELLKSLRLEKNMNLRDAASLSGLSHTYISDIEKGYRRGSKTPLNPSFDTLKRLAKAYNYPYHKLLQTAGYIDDNLDPIESVKDEFEKYITDKDLENVLMSYDFELDGKKLSEEDKEFAIRILKAALIKKGP